jgi:hypothetical protein
MTLYLLPLMKEGTILCELSYNLYDAVSSLAKYVV